MFIDTKTGNIIRFIQDYQDINTYEIDDELIVGNFVFRVYLTFISNILWTIRIYLTEKSIEKLLQQSESFRDRLNTIKSIYNLTLNLITKKDNMSKKGNFGHYNWGFISLEKATSKWPNVKISYDYDIIKNLIN